MRRPLVMLSIMALTASLFGCSSSASDKPAETTAATTAPQATKAPEPTKAPGQPVVYKEAPSLAGKGLPPVAERLPKEPKIPNPLPADQLKVEVGTYGGTLRSATHETGFDSLVFCMLNEPLLNSPGLLGDEVTGNVLKGFKASDDMKEYTFFMREGLKWSDGQPVTTEDVKFAVEDVLFNQELTPVFPTWLRSASKNDGTPMKLEVVDQYTYKVIFDQPYGGFPLTLAIEGWRGYTDFLKPKHYLTQFHKKYAKPEDLDAKIKEEKLQPGEWVKLFNLKDVTNFESVTPNAIGFPVLGPWIETKATAQTVEYERNPYYFKVDTAGNQLPYIDKVVTTYVQDLQALGMKVIAGEVDHSNELIALNQLSLFKENESKGGYKIWIPKMHRTGADITLNMNYDDPNWQKVVQDIRFRQALNLALNKDEIAKTIYLGMAKPSPMQGTEFNLDKANKILDDMGMTKGSDGYRVGPDGKRFTIPFEIQEWRPDTIPMAELVVEQWKALGLDVTMKQIDGTLWGTRNAANELQATLVASHGPVLWTFPDWGQAEWAPLWNQWQNSQGKSGQEPPAAVKEFYKKLEDLRALPLADAKKKYQEVRQSMKDNLWYFIPIEDIASPAAINTKLGNYSDGGFEIAHIFGPEIWYYKK